MSPPPRSPLLQSPTPVGELGLPLLGGAKGAAAAAAAAAAAFSFAGEGGVARPSRGTQAVAALLDTWGPWLGYLGLGVGLQDFVLGSLVAGGAALLGLAFQAYRCVHRRLLAEALLNQPRGGGRLADRRTD